MLALEELIHMVDNNQVHPEPYVNFVARLVILHLSATIDLIQSFKVETLLPTFMRWQQLLLIKQTLIGI